MKNNQEPKYLASLFIIGFLMNIIKRFYLLFPAIILLLIGIIIPWCLFIGSALLFLDIVLSLGEQIVLRNTTLNSDNPNFKEFQDAMLSPGWKDNIKNLMESKIDNYSEEDSDEKDSEDSLS